MKWKALAIGVISYPILWFAWLLLSPQYEHHALHTYSMVMHILYWMLSLFSGMLAALLARSNGFKHASIVGIILGIGSLIAWYYLGILDTNMLTNLAAIIIFAGLGGAIVQGITSFRAKRKQAE